MTGDQAGLGRPAEVGRSPAAGIARGAAVIASLTIAARIAGLLRTLAFSQTVGATCLGTAYVTANQVPNLVQELVLGGAISSVMVPVLARSAERSAADPAEKAQVRQITSALLTWTLLILAPITLAIVVAAGPIATALNPVNHSAQCVHGQVVSMTADMLRVFAPQAVLYGLSVVLFGLLQAYRRFAGYALAPLVASLVIIASYIAFVPLGRGLPLGRLPVSAQLVLSVGATLGIAMLVVVAAVPTWRMHLRLRPVLRLPPGVARRASGLALVGLAEIVASEISTVVIIELANGRGSTGALVMYNYASQVFSTMNAVLALSVVLSAFPVLAARDGPVFDRTSAGSTRAVVLVTCLGMALIAAVAVPAAHVLAQQPDQVPQLTQAFILYAPGLVGMGVIANLSRVMLAIGRLTVAAVAVSGSWLLAIGVQVILVQLVHARLVVGMLTLGVSIAQILAAIPLVVVTRRIRGKAAVAGIGRALVAGVAAAAAGGVVGIALGLLLPKSHKLFDAGDAVVAAVCAAIVFGAVIVRFDNGDLQLVLARLARFSGSASQVNRLFSDGAGEPFATVRRAALGLASHTRASKWMLSMNSDRHTESGKPEDAGSPAFQMTRVERQAALGVGILAGGGGAYAVFASSNQAGTVMLLLISLVFLLAGLEGTPLLRVLAARSGGDRPRHRFDRPLRRAREQRTGAGAGLDGVRYPDVSVRSDASARPDVSVRPEVVRQDADTAADDELWPSVSDTSP